MRRIVWVITAVFLTASLISGCANMTAKQNGFLKGAAVGAAVGAGGGAFQGHQVDDSNRDRGAVIGAVAGALVGGLIGAAMAKEEVPPPPAPDVAPPEPKPTPMPEEVVEPEPEPVPPPSVREKIILRGINFDFDKSAVKPEFEPILDEAARILEAHPDVSVVVEGHTCWIGTAKYNQGLSERRARSVQKYLVNQGVAATRMTAIGHGETQPIADNGTEEGRRVNRRVEFKILE